MFGLSFGEVVVLVVVFIVVVGPRNMPVFLRNVVRIVGDLRRLLNDVRAETGIDRMVELEQLRAEFEQLRRVASGQVDELTRLAESETRRAGQVVIERAREWPRIGCDAGGAISEDEAPYLPEPASAEPVATTL